MRKMKKVVVRDQKLVDILCDSCGGSCRGDFNPEEYEMAQIIGCFNEGDTAGDRFQIEICQQCFFDLMEWFLLDKKGVCDYHNVVDQEESADIDDLRIYFAHRRAGTLPSEEDYEECEGCEDCEG